MCERTIKLLWLIITLGATSYFAWHLPPLSPFHYWQLYNFPKLLFYLFNWFQIEKNRKKVFTQSNTAYKILILCFNTFTDTSPFCIVQLLTCVQQTSLFILKFTLSAFLWWKLSDLVKNILLYRPNLLELVTLWSTPLRIFSCFQNCYQISSLQICLFLTFFFFCIAICTQGKALNTYMYVCV